MSSIDRLQPVAAAGLGFALSALIPKNLLMAAAAGTVIASADVSGGQSAAAVAVFTVMAACSVLVPVLGYLILGTRLDPTLATTKDWLMSNNAAVMSVLLFVFGANLLGDAIGILTA
jgi:hypothetical protein